MNHESTSQGMQEFLRTLHQPTSTAEIASVAVNDGRLLTTAERLTVLLKSNSRLRVKAVTGQDLPNERSAELILLRKLVAKSLEIGEPIYFDGSDPDALHPSIAPLLVDYLSESGATSISTFLLNGNEQERAFGCLVAQWYRDSAADDNSCRTLELISGHLASALHKALLFENILFRRLLSRLGSAFSWVFHNKLYSVAAFLLAVISSCIVLCFLPWNYKITCNGTLLPSERQDIFAPWDANVRSIYVSDGDSVEANQLLLELESDDLKIEALALETVVQEKQKVLRALEAQIDLAERRGSQEDSVQLQGEAQKTEIEIRNTSKRLDLVRKRIRELHVRAPISGTVVAFQIRQNLLDRPVQRGERLAQVMETGKGWRLELYVPERYGGHALGAFKENGKLDVEFVLSTAVEQTYFATVSQVASRVEESQAEGSYLESLAQVQDHQELEGKHIGAKVIAKVKCGTKSLGYCLFGDVVDFIRQRVWF